jgi:ApaG protein
MSEQVFPRIEVKVVTQYLDDQSNPAEQRFAFAYTITLRNHGFATAQLISRHWIITDALGETYEVKGLGVVGQQPLLAADQAFEYTSGSVMKTPVGTMRGHYHWVLEDGTPFAVEIPEFALAVPHVLH